MPAGPEGLLDDQSSDWTDERQPATANGDEPVPSSHSLSLTHSPSRLCLCLHLSISLRFRLRLLFCLRLRLSVRLRLRLRLNCPEYLVRLPARRLFSVTQLVLSRPQLAR